MLKMDNGDNETVAQIKERLRKEFSVNCPAPWTSMVISPEGYFATCCWNPHDSRYNIRDFKTIDEVWNSAYYRNLRKLIAENRYEEARCTPYCVFLGGKTEAPFDPGWVLGALTGEFVAVGKHIAVEADFMARNETDACAAPPSILMTTLFYDCNLSCGMCIQVGERHSKAQLGMADLSMLLSRADSLSTWNILGGEIFIDKEFINFLSKFNPESPALPKIVIVTNGTMLNETNLAKVTSIRYPFLVFSIDGATPEIYNRVRVGGDFDSVMENLKRAVNLYRKNGKCESILWHYVLMKSTLADMESAYDICQELGILFDIERIMGAFPDENIFDYPYNLADTTDVEIALSFLRKGKISNSYRTSSLILDLEVVAAKVTQVNLFLSESPEKAAGRLNDGDFARELINACLYGSRKSELRDRLPDVLLLVNDIPLRLRQEFLILLNLIPLDYRRDEVISHLRSLAPEWVSSRYFSDNLVMSRLLNDIGSDSLAFAGDQIHSLAFLLSPGDEDNGKGKIVGYEVVGALFLAWSQRLKNDYIYQFINKYLLDDSLDGNTITSSWKLLLYNVASWREREKMTDDAIYLFERLAALADTDKRLIAGCHFHLARMKREKGDLNGARYNVELCLQNNPEHQAALRIMGETAVTEPIN